MVVYWCYICKYYFIVYINSIRQLLDYLEVSVGILQWFSWSAANPVYMQQAFTFQTTWLTLTGSTLDISLLELGDISVKSVASSRIVA